MPNDKIFDDTDGFWSLDDLLPPKEKTPYSPKKRNTDTVDIEITGEASEPTGEKIPKRQYPPISEQPKSKSFDEWLSERKKYEQNRYTYGKVTLSEYIPDNPLIKRVTISADPNARRICERFLVDAHRLYDSECEFKGNVPFQSYYPQYSQMSAKQIECYIGFRTDVRKGVYDTVDTAYIYLYLYELINTPSKASPEERTGIICELIKAYHELDEKLFSDMCNWLCDMCLIHNVKLRADVFGDLIVKVTSVCRIKEFFLGANSELSRDYALIAAVTSYDYKKSRFYTDNRAYYDALIPKAVSVAINEMSKNDSRFLKEHESVCTLIHESYNGALCSGTVKCTISLECVCITRSDSVKKSVSETVKYAENCLRSQLGIKPRLTVNYLLAEYKAMIKEFFAENKIYVQKQKKTLDAHPPSAEELPEYEALYEPKSIGVSFDEAKEIEESSWEVTKLFVNGSESETKSLPDVTEESPQKPTAPLSEVSAQSENSELSGLLYIMKKDYASFNALARANGLLPDAFADKINAFALEKTGDIVLIGSENGYDIIEDYMTDIEDMLSESGLI